MRDYKVFGSKDGVTWHYLSNVDASSGEQAMRKAFDEHGQAFTHYAASPQRNWSQGEPQIKQREPVVSWKSAIDGQLTVDDVIEEAKKEGVTLEAERGTSEQRGAQGGATPSERVRA